jgi:hypothetical protein
MVVVQKLSFEHFKRYIFAQVSFLCEINLRHTTFTEEMDDSIWSYLLVEHGLIYVVNLLIF